MDYGRRYFNVKESKIDRLKNKLIGFGGSKYSPPPARYAYSIVPPNTDLARRIGTVEPDTGKRGTVVLLWKHTGKDENLSNAELVHANLIEETTFDWGSIGP